MIHVFTSADSNYLGKVRTLASSVRRHHPEIAFHVVLAEPPPLSISALEEGVSSVLSLADLGLDHDRSWLFSHSVVELCTAVKGAALDLLLSRSDTDAVLYLDPDIVVFSRLDDLLASLQETSILLTPHLLAPEDEHEAILDNEVCALRHGVFNLGFLGVRPTDEGRALVAWWRRRLDLFCWAEPESGIFTDQKWMDLVPCFYRDVVILRDSRFNVAPWNVSRRRVAGNFDCGFTVDAKPLGFYHFTGFDSGAHEAMLRKYAPGNRSLAMLTDWYHRRTRALASARGHSPLARFSDGSPIAAIHRLIYRRRPDLRAAFPDPFAAGGRSYLDWLRRQGPLEYPELRPIDPAAAVTANQGLLAAAAL